MRGVRCGAPITRLMKSHERLRDRYRSVEAAVGRPKKTFSAAYANRIALEVTGKEERRRRSVLASAEGPKSKSACNGSSDRPRKTDPKNHHGLRCPLLTRSSTTAAADKSRPHTLDSNFGPKLADRLTVQRYRHNFGSRGGIKGGERSGACPPGDTIGTQRR